MYTVDFDVFIKAFFFPRFDITSCIILLYFCMIPCIAFLCTYYGLVTLNLQARLAALVSSILWSFFCFLGFFVFVFVLFLFFFLFFWSTQGISHFLAVQGPVWVMCGPFRGPDSSTPNQGLHRGREAFKHQRSEGGLQALGSHLACLSFPTGHRRVKSESRGKANLVPQNACSILKPSVLQYF